MEHHDRMEREVVTVAYKFRSRKNGKTLAYHERAGLTIAQRLAGQPLPRLVAEPMHNDKRAAGYIATNGSSKLTGPQRRRMSRHLNSKCTDPDHTCTPGMLYHQLAEREYLRRPVRQHFNQSGIDNQHRPTGRTGRMRWGTPLSKEQLGKLFLRVLVPVTGREVRTAAGQDVADHLFGRRSHG